MKYFKIVFNLLVAANFVFWATMPWTDAMPKDPRPMLTFEALVGLAWFAMSMLNELLLVARERLQDVNNQLIAKQAELITTLELRVSQLTLKMKHGIRASEDTHTHGQTS